MDDRPVPVAGTPILAIASRFVGELRRRNVPRAALLYLGAVWALAQGISQLGPSVGAPGWATRWFLIAAAIGFPAWLAFAWFYEFTSQGFQREQEAGAGELPVRPASRWLDFAIIGVLALAVVLLLTDRLAASGGQRSTVDAAPSKSIAVLPLLNDSDDKDQQYFSDGLTESLINALSQFDGLVVIGRNSAFQFRNSSESSGAIAAKLGVANLLVGSVRKLGDTVRINAQLVQAATGRTLWSKIYDRPYRDLFQLQDEITGEVAESLSAKLLSHDSAAMQDDRPPGGSLDAYNAYLQGRFHAEQGTEGGFRLAIEQYENAVRIDPRYALAWAQLGDTRMRLAAAFLGGDALSRMNTQASEAVATALELDPDLAAAHAARGQQAFAIDLDWRRAMAEYHEALRLAPNDGRIKVGYGIALAAAGHVGQALETTRRGLAVDPLNGRGYLTLARYLSALDRFDEAEAAVRKAIELQPSASANYHQMTSLLVERGDAKGALSAAMKEPEGAWRDFAIALARQVAGDPATADGALKAIIDTWGDSAAYQIAQTYALRRDPDRVFEWLGRAWTTRDPGIVYLLADPIVLRYRNDPRFAAFCREVGLPTTTDATGMPL